MTRRKFTLALLLMLPVSAVAKEPDITGHWSGAFRSRHVHVTPFTADLTILPDEVPGHHGRKLGQLKHGSDPSGCLVGDVNVQIDRQGSNLVIAASTGKGDTVTLVGVLNQTGSVATLNYVTNGSISGKCESDDGTVSLTKK